MPSSTGAHRGTISHVRILSPRLPSPSARGTSMWADFRGYSTVFAPPITIHLALVALYPELVTRRELRPLARGAAAADRRSPGRSRDQAERMARQICVDVVSF
jgi:hypothetical protein